MKAKTRVLLGVLVLMIPGAAAAGTVTAELRRAASARDPGELVGVIVRLSDPIDVDAFHSRGRGRRRASLLRALQRRAKGVEGPARSFLLARGAQEVRGLWIVNGLAARVPAGSVEELAAQAGVERVSLDRRIRVPRVSPAASARKGRASQPEWNVTAIRAPELWDLGHDGSGVVVAVMDTGVDPAHPDLGPRWRGGSNSWFDPNGQHAAPYDGNGHGTQALGLAVGGDAGGSAIGVAPGAQWIAVKIFDDSDEAALSAIHLGFQWLLDPDGDPDVDDAPDIVNNSWVLDGSVGICDGEFAADLAALEAAEIAVVFAAGNTGPASDTSVSPSNDVRSVAVGAVDATSTIGSFSGRGPSACDGGLYPGIAAPGVNVSTANLTLGGIFPDSYVTVTGTSFSAPHVAGGLALLKSAFPAATVSQLRSALRDTALDLGAAGPDSDYGAGMLDLAEALGWLEDAGSSPAPGRVRFEAGSVEVAEDAGALAVRVWRTGGSAGTIGVDYATEEGTAIAGEDYASTAGTLVFFDGETERTFTVDILDDASVEGDEDLDLVLSNPTGGASLEAPTIARVTIVDDEVPAAEDADGDGFASDVDCDDADAAVHPGAPEIKHDDVDQDCNGYDLTIEITRARYTVRKGRLELYATSDLGSGADLAVSIDLGGGGSVTESMAWKSKKGRWETRVERFEQVYGSPPVSVTVFGVEGSESGPVELR